MSFNDGDDDKFGDGAVYSSDAGESRHFRDEHFQRDSSQDEYVEYIGTIEKEMRRLLPHLPDLTLLRWLREKVQDPILGLTPPLSSSSSDARSKS